MTIAMATSKLPLELLMRGKVRDVYVVDADACSWSRPIASARSTS